MNISERIKIIRKKNGLTQKELAEKTGLSVASIQGYEQGKYLPKVEQLQKLATALNASLYDLTQYAYGITYNEQELHELKIAMSKDEQAVQQLLDNRILYLYHKLNEKGKDQAIELMELLTKVPEYQKDHINPDQ